MRKNVLIIFFIAYFFSILQSFAIEDPLAEPLKFDLRAVINRVDSQNIDIKISKASLNIAKANYIKSFSPLFPSIEAGFSAEKFDGAEVILVSNPVDIDRTTYRPTLSANHSISLGGADFFRIGIYKNKYKKLKTEHTKTVQNSLKNSLELYYKWVSSCYEIKKAEAEYEEAKKMLKIAQNKETLGFNTSLNVMQSKHYLSDTEKILLETKSKRLENLLNLRTCLNIDHFNQITLKDTRIEPLKLFKDNLSLPSLFLVAQKNHPDLARLEFLVSESKNELKFAWANLLPTVNLSTYIRGIGPDFSGMKRTSQGNFSLNIDLLRYMGVHSFSSIKEAKFKLEKAVLEKEKAINSFYVDISKTYNAYNISKKQLSVAKEKMALAKEEYQINLDKYECGDISQLDLLSSKTALTRSKADYVNSVSISNISQIQLLHSVGILSADLLLKHLDSNEEVGL